LLCFITASWTASLPCTIHRTLSQFQASRGS
jgi:hypothetical protein